MADLTQTAENVGISGKAVTVISVQVGEAVTQGMPGYRNASDNKYYQGEGGDTAAKAVSLGVFMTPAATDGYAFLATKGPVDLGATLVVGTVYAQSSNKGKVAPVADLTTGDYVTTLGVASAADALQLNIDSTGIQVPA